VQQLTCAGCCSADGPHLEFGGKALDASPRVTSLWMLSDFTAFNGGTWVIRKWPLAQRG